VGPGAREDPRARRRRSVNAAERQRALRLLGLGVRSRGVIVGVEQVREAAKRNKVVLAVVAIDASSNSLDKVVPLLNARRVRFIEVPSAAELGAAVGREQTTVVGIVDRQLAAGVSALVTSAKLEQGEDV
jgi:ribosomal protein L7Ae-like RNA K-turn-binding protein